MPRTAFATRSRPLLRLLLDEGGVGREGDREAVALEARPAWRPRALRRASRSPRRRRRPPPATAPRSARARSRPPAATRLLRARTATAGGGPLGARCGSAAAPPQARAPAGVRGRRAAGRPPAGRSGTSAPAATGRPAAGWPSGAPSRAGCAARCRPSRRRSRAARKSIARRISPCERRSAWAASRSVCSAVTENESGTCPSVWTTNRWRRWAERSRMNCVKSRPDSDSRCTVEQRRARIARRPAPRPAASTSSASATPRISSTSSSFTSLPP